jgi:RHS repeat-associated protein
LPPRFAVSQANPTQPQQLNAAADTRSLTNRQTNSLPRACARAKIASREKFALYAQSASKNLRQVLEGTRKNRFAYDKRTSGGRFLSIDPVVTDANTGGSFNRYAYASNSPYKYVDPDGRQERAAEAFSDQFRNDAASGNSGVYEPFHTPVVIATIGMVVGPPIAAAVIAGAPAGATVAAGGAAAKGAEVAETVAVRTTQAGDKAVRITRADGSVKDISPARVKEYVPNTHPKAPPGTLDKVKFENPLPGSKGFKREPTAEELNVLKEAK